MTELVPLTAAALDLAALGSAEGRIAVLVGPDGRLGTAARRVNTMTRKAVERFAASDRFFKMAEGDAAEIAVPGGLAAEALVIVKCGPRPDSATARKAGAALAKVQGNGALLVLAGGVRNAAEIALGLSLRAYDYADHKSKKPDSRGPVTLMVNRPEELDLAGVRAVAEGVVFTRDLVNAPANDLTTTRFAERLQELASLGIKVKVLDEKKLEKLGMGSLLCVGQGSASPSMVVVMEWRGGDKETAPFALVGKGVVFDTGGISLKPAAGMEDMTMDMGGAGTVAGVMKTLALRGARANVVGLVGLVENMPSGTATRPGDVVKSMKGDTIEVINTDAEGRLVLADVLWYAQEKFAPLGMINLATLTGAIVVALGSENTGVFSNDDNLCNAFLAAADAEGEGAWRMPMGKAYDDLLKSDIADMKNVGGREGGSITAAQFLRRFVKDETPWCHLDIAGTASRKKETALAPKGATGWGVMALNRLIRDRYEG